MGISQTLRWMGFSDRDFHVTFDHDGLHLHWTSALPQPSEAEIAAAELPAAKHFAIAANRAEARRRIEAKWPDPIQRSAAMGIYPAEKIEQMKIDIAAVIEAENTAADQIDAATTVAEVEAVTPAWPNI